jgi:hypothetical protein
VRVGAVTDSVLVIVAVRVGGAVVVVELDGLVADEVVPDSEPELVVGLVAPVAVGTVRLDVVADVVLVLV